MPFSIEDSVSSVSLVGDQAHDGPVLGEHFRPDQDPEDGEDLQEEVLGGTRFRSRQ